MKWEMVSTGWILIGKEVRGPNLGAFLFRGGGRDFGFLLCLRKEVLDGFSIEITECDLCSGKITPAAKWSLRM